MSPANGTRDSTWWPLQKRLYMPWRCIIQCRHKVSKSFFLTRSCSLQLNELYIQIPPCWLSFDRQMISEQKVVSVDLGVAVIVYMWTTGQLGKHEEKHSRDRRIVPVFLPQRGWTPFLFVAPHTVKIRYQQAVCFPNTHSGSFCIYSIKWCPRGPQDKFLPQKCPCPVQSVLI